MERIRQRTPSLQTCRPRSAIDRAFRRFQAIERAANVERDPEARLHPPGRGCLAPQFSRRLSGRCWQGALLPADPAGPSVRKHPLEEPDTARPA